ncbi:2-amino-4,5-dihydroxy-6-one-heptanoic acid-7-phosphate synthase [Actinocorallia sp. API 0066]|uniref:2-amino-3,7-dideoxy-D-threo-hept-6-ulosonate synthase n=1 Tax=Actinocorallia sp. API 0066 TaxID=2896846 RepID=UPI001E50CE73|nr:2-amino-3,7-dideoxy-D-threo-hept-6-ulosonate synthase [Actinocorallia sp. API 0066]MCD0448653.1 2-amino-4,5-dihydroxy-6-one-heptanoic acid-7-phosphate synthase [Actinocorallia sp. API 0066]
MAVHAVHNVSFARGLRLHRLFRHEDGRLLVVPLDHSVADGPLVRGDLNPLLGELAGTGVDAVVLHKGRLRHIDHRWFGDMALIVHLSASTRHASDPDAKYLVGYVEEALRLGADAVSVHVNVGSRAEARQIADLAVVAGECDRWNMPLLAMMYVRGPRIGDSRAPELVAHAASLAADLGADIVKTDYAGTPERMADVVRTCPIPVIVAGGSRLAEPEAVLAYVSDALRGGVAGVAMGRNVFQADQPGRMAAAVARLVHEAPRVPEGNGAENHLILAP